jgi:PadR family transcriptional regulator, regulatory protein PadR
LRARSLHVVGHHGLDRDPRRSEKWPAPAEASPRGVPADTDTHLIPLNLFSIVKKLFIQYGEEMRKGAYLGHFELMVLLVLMRLGDDAYGVTVANELEQQTGREVVIASVYATLERLQERELVSSSLGDATPERGGRAKRYFKITGAGVREVREARQSLISLWKGLPELKGER